jgi:hypothetical protein
MEHRVNGDGMMECWNDERIICYEKTQYSNIPLFHYSNRTFSWIYLMMSSVEVPGRKISLIPAFLSAGISSTGIMPPPKTRISSAFFSLRIWTTFGKRLLWAPDRLERPTISTLS